MMTECKVEELQGEKYTLVSDSQDVKATLESIGKLDQLSDYGCLLVAIENGDYSEVWGVQNCTPWLHTWATRLV
jgi:hypothetical protein